MWIVFVGLILSRVVEFIAAKVYFESNLTYMYFLNSITFNAGLKFEFKDPIVGQKLKASIFMITNKNQTQYGNWTFPDKFLWDEVYYS